MIYLGPITAAVVLWSRARLARSGRAHAGARGRARLPRRRGGVGQHVIQYWDHAHFVQVREATFDFWQNLQFVMPLAALAMIGLVGLVFPSWLTSRGPLVPAALMAVAAGRQPVVARGPARGLPVPAVALCGAHGGGRAARRPDASRLGSRRLAEAAAAAGGAARADGGRRLATAMFLLVLGGAVPEIWLTRQWVDYLAWFRGVVTSHTGIVSAEGPAARAMALSPVRPGLDLSGPERAAAQRAGAGDRGGAQRLSQRFAVRSRVRDGAARSTDTLWR